jgi:hypothetical protein
VSIAVPLAEAKTSAVPSLEICVARSVEDPKFNVTVVPGFADSKSEPICVKAAVSDEAANTVRSVDHCAGVLEVVLDEHAASATVRTINSRLIKRPPPSRSSL